jgi:hypothetical protein
LHRIIHRSLASWRDLPAQAVEAEVAEFLARHAAWDRRRRTRVVRHGHLPESRVMTGIKGLLGPILEKAEDTELYVQGAAQSAREKRPYPRQRELTTPITCPNVAATILGERGPNADHQSSR